MGESWIHRFWWGSRSDIARVGSPGCSLGTPSSCGNAACRTSWFRSSTIGSAPFGGRRSTAASSRWSRTSRSPRPRRWPHEAEEGIEVRDHGDVPQRRRPPLHGDFGDPDVPCEGRSPASQEQSTRQWFAGIRARDGHGCQWNLAPERYLVTLAQSRCAVD